MPFNPLPQAGRRGDGCRILAAVLVSGLLLGGCGGMSTGDTGPREKVNLASGVQNAKANAFNPYLHTSLPNLRANDAESQAMLQKWAAGQPPSKVKPRTGPSGSRKFIPYFLAIPKRRTKCWCRLRILPRRRVKRFGRRWQRPAALFRPSSARWRYLPTVRNITEPISWAWASGFLTRPGQAMQYMTYALSRWNEVKAAQKKKGRVAAFNNEYDATAESSDFPIH